MSEYHAYIPESLTFRWASFFFLLFFLRCAIRDNHTHALYQQPLSPICQLLLDKQLDDRFDQHRLTVFTAGSTKPHTLFTGSLSQSQTYYTLYYPTKLVTRSTRFFNKQSLRRLAFHLSDEQHQCLFIRAANSRNARIVHFPDHSNLSILQIVNSKHQLRNRHIPHSNLRHRTSQEPGTELQQSN